MRFKTGDIVEVMNNKEVPVSWRTAEILSSSGHTYTVQYDYYPGIAEDPVLEIVPSKFVRPCPPLMQGVKSFMTGDVFEVFYQHSWKIAAVLKILRGRKESNKKKTDLTVAAIQNQYLARLLGCSQELVVDRSNIRMRQSWHDGKWILMGKSFQDVITIEPPKSNGCQKMKFKAPQFNARAKIQPKKDCAIVPVDAASRESPVISSRSTKRMSPYDSSIIEEHYGHARKLRATEKQGRKLRVVADPVLEKVDAVAYPKETLGEKYMHTSSNILSNGYYQIERAKLNDVLGYSGVRSPEKSTSDSDACSVGSCSVNNPSPRFSHFVSVHCEETDTLCSDAESSYGSGSNKKRSSLPPIEEPEGNSWRHASFASNGLKMMPGFAAFLLALNFGRFSRLLPKICYGLWPLPGITQFNLQYFSVFQDLLDMLTCLLLEGSICKHGSTRFVFQVMQKVCLLVVL